MDLQVILFVGINFLITFICNLLLNDLSNNKIISTNLSLIYSFQEYFKDKSILLAAFYPSIILAIFVFFVIILSKFILKFWIPENINNLIKFNIIALIMGFIMNLFIRYSKIFGNSLNNFYKKNGSSIIISLGLLFSINASYIIIKTLCEVLKRKMICNIEK